jgi:hypothetical protein
MLGGAKVLRKAIAGGGNTKFRIERRVELVFVTAIIGDFPPGKVEEKISSHTVTPDQASDVSSGKTEDKISQAVPVKGKVGFVTSPYAPDKGMIDVRGFPSGSQIKDPYTGRILLVP